MRESITSRVGRIISGSVNAVIDAVENAAPETVMEEAIREIDGAIDEVRVELGRVIANKHLANQRLMEENSKHEELAEKIELAVNEERDDLAEVAIAKQLDIEAQIPILESSIADGSTQEKELEGYVSALKAKKREMKDELKRYRESQQEAASLATSSGTPSNSNIESKVNKAEESFERVVENTTGLMGRMSTKDVQSTTKLAELDDLAHKNRVRERLEAIKNKNTKSD